MLPYIHLPEIKLGPVPIHWFGILVAIGVIIGITLARRRAKTHGINADKLESFINWMLLAGFIGAHVLDVIFYHPEEIAKRPWGLLMIWESLSSFGGFVGALIGALLWKKYRNGGKSILGYIDLILSVFPVAWIFGRMGCAVVHDHKGKAAEASWLTVGFPDGPHYDLGLLEAMFAVVMSLIVASLWGKPRRVGTYSGIVAMLYAPVRLAMDFLRASSGPTGDPRYGGLTPAQWACVGLFVVGAVIFARRRPLEEA